MSDKPACEGGSPVRTEPFPPWPYFQPEMIEAAMEPLQDRQGQLLDRRPRHEVRAGLRRLGGREVRHLHQQRHQRPAHRPRRRWASAPATRSSAPATRFIASCFCVLQAGAVPVFADVEKNGHTHRPQEHRGEDLREDQGDHRRAPVRLMCDMDADHGDRQEAQPEGRRGLRAGPRRRSTSGKKAGTIGDVGAFSFCQSKHFTTGGEGGAVVTDDEDAAWTMPLLPRPRLRRPRAAAPAGTRREAAVHPQLASASTTA